MRDARSRKYKLIKDLASILFEEDDLNDEDTSLFYELMSHSSIQNAMRLNESKKKTDE